MNRIVCRLLATPSLALFALFARAEAAPPANPVIVANTARFTVITANCIRIEYAPEGKFVDAPSTFAANRSAHDDDFKLGTRGTATTIDTGAIKLTYTPDGKPLSPSNLKAEIHVGSVKADWTPGAANPGNLGGTLRTLDGVSGPMDLGQGLLSRDGWYLLDDSHSDLLTIDWVQIRPANKGTDWYLFGYGDDYRAGLKAMAAIGGAVPMPRKYALGAWYSRYWPYSSDDYRQIVKEYADHDFPLDNVVLDMDWHKDGWTGWSWNPKLLPDAPALLKFFHDQGLHDTLNLHPADGVAPREDRYDAFMQDMGATDAATQKKTLPFDAGDKKYMDTLFKDIFTPLENDGVDFWWLDWQQYPFTLSVPDLTNLFWLNTLLYQRTAQNDQRGLSFSRWAGWGDHRHPIQFSGDANTGFKMLAFQVPFTSTAGNVGCFFWSHDIGGHQGGRNEESYTRWVQFGATTPALRSHSTRSADMDRRPWLYPKWAEDSMRISFHLRSELFPYLYTSVQQTAHDTIPFDRPMYLDYGHDERAYHNAQEFLMGDNLLVAPIASVGVGPSRVASQTVWFPKGSRYWYNALTGERYDADSEALVAADINEFPIFVRGGVPMPMQPYQARMATAPLTQLVVRCYPGDDGKTGEYTLYEDDGVTTAYTKNAFATTLLRYQNRKGITTVTIAPTTGTYAGQPTQRSYMIELPDTTPAAQATVDGQPVAVNYDLKAMVNRITVPARPIGQGAVVQVQTASGDVEALHTQAVARRMSGIIGHTVPGTTVQELLTEALADPATTDKVRETLLAVAGVGVVHKNQGTYLYHGKIVDTLYAPANVLDNAPKVTTLSDNRLSVTVNVGGKAIDLPHDNSMLQVVQSSDNVARTAKVTVNGVENGYGFAGATDGVIDGYPNDRNAEWSSGKLEGASIRLDWSTPQTVDHILLFDRPNLTDQITAGTVEFSDGTKLDVGELPNDGIDPFDLKFPAKTINWLKFTATAVKPKTESCGLSEIVVLKAKTP